jgi:hypothetical protein
MGLFPSYFNKKVNAETKDMCEKMNTLTIDERTAAYKYISKLHPKVNIKKRNV